MMKKITLLATFVFACLQFSSAQTYFSDDFSDNDISDWTTYDADGDSYGWGLGNYATGGSVDIPEFDSVLASRSWTGAAGPLSPDNYIVSGAIDLTTAGSGLQLEYAYGTTQGSPYHYEEYSIYVTTSNSLADLQAATAVHNEILNVPSSRQTNVVDLSSFAGQIVYVSFRHHNTYDMNMMLIDDVVVRIPVERDAIVEGVNVNRFSLQSSDNQLTLDVRNNGSSTITALEVNWSDGTMDQTATITANIAPGAVATLNHPMMVNYATTVEKDITVTVNTVNGNADESPSDNTATTKFNTLSQSGTKKIFIEEATGTWCGFCPRGAVGLDYMYSTYPESVVAVAVHNSDPMLVPEYDNGIGQYISGYPSGAVDRILGDVNPQISTLESVYNQRINDLVPVAVSADATQSGNELTITVNATFFSNFSSAGSDFRFGAIITENGVTGTGDGSNAVNNDYDQVNYYSNNALGAMGGYETLPDPVPATQMVYDHVGRALLGGFNGEAGSVPATVVDGQTVSHTFTYTIPSASNINNMNIVPVVLSQNGAGVIGVNEVSVSQALSVEKVSGIDSIKIYPNPAKENINIAFEASNGNYNISVTDMLGRTVLTQSFEGLFGNQTLQLPVSDLNSGYYLITIKDGQSSYSSKFIANH
jgi:thiol-disulfide isomerase/thioredoxin